MRGVLLVRESNMQLLRYSLDTHVSYSTYYPIFKSQKGSIKALNSYYNYLIDYLINYLIDYTIGFIIITS